MLGWQMGVAGVVGVVGVADVADTGALLSRPMDILGNIHKKIRPDNAVKDGFEKPAVPPCFGCLRIRTLRDTIISPVVNADVRR
jgi:hypothetical protein